MSDLPIRMPADASWNAARSLFATQRWERLRQVCGLTPRQLQVAQLICEGCDSKEIAVRLGLSVDTVRLHIKALFARLDVGNRVGVVMALVERDQRIERAAPRAEQA